MDRRPRADLSGPMALERFVAETTRALPGSLSFQDKVALLLPLFERLGLDKLYLVVNYYGDEMDPHTQHHASNGYTFSLDAAVREYLSSMDRFYAPSNCCTEVNLECHSCGFWARLRLLFTENKVPFAFLSACVDPDIEWRTDLGANFSGVGVLQDLYLEHVKPWLVNFITGIGGRFYVELHSFSVTTLFGDPCPDVDHLGPMLTELYARDLSIDLTVKEA